jgi:hypothetical protein
VLAAAPPDTARLWIYREYEPADTLARPFVRMNGAVIAISEPGGSSFRDAPPGVYTVTVDTVGHDVNQFVTINPRRRADGFCESREFEAVGELPQLYG